MINSDIEDGILELHNILKENYTSNENFKNELFSSLAKYTGNNNLGILCGYIMDDNNRHKKM